MSEMISVGACPTCEGPVQHISEDGVRVDYRHVDLSTVKLERFREIAIDALQKITGEPNYSPADLLEHSALAAAQVEREPSEGEDPLGHLPGILESYEQGYRENGWHPELRAKCCLTLATLREIVARLRAASSPEGRPDPTNCQNEPPFPGHETVAMSLRDPDMVAHRRTYRCAIERPHAITECSLFRSPGGREPDAWIVKKAGRVMPLIYHADQMDNAADDANDYAEWLNAGGRIHVAEVVPVYFGTPSEAPGSASPECGGER